MFRHIDCGLRMFQSRPPAFHSDVASLRTAGEPLLPIRGWLDRGSQSSREWEIAYCLLTSSRTPLIVLKIPSQKLPNWIPWWQCINGEMKVFFPLWFFGALIDFFEETLNPFPLLFLVPTRRDNFHINSIELITDEDWWTYQFSKYSMVISIIIVYRSKFFMKLPKHRNCK